MKKDSWLYGVAVVIRIVAWVVETNEGSGYFSEVAEIILRERDHRENLDAVLHCGR